MYLRKGDSFYIDKTTRSPPLSFGSPTPPGVWQSPEKDANIQLFMVSNYSRLKSLITYN